jgi:hypothetical protein
MAEDDEREDSPQNDEDSQDNTHSEDSMNSDKNSESGISPENEEKSDDAQEVEEEPPKEDEKPSKAESEQEEYEDVHQNEEPKGEDAQDEEPMDDDLQQDVEPKSDDVHDDEPNDEAAQDEGPLDDEPQQDDDLTAIGQVKEYNAEELAQEIEDSENNDEKTPNEILLQIQEERKQLEEERAKLEKDKEEKAKKEQEKREKERREEDEKPIIIPKEQVKSFAEERRKRKSLERTRTYLIGGEYALLIIFVLAQLVAEGVSTDPLRVPLENTFYILIVFFLIIKIQSFAFRYLNMIYSGTVQRKSIGVELFRSLEWPIIIGWIFVVAILIIPPTAGFISTLIEIFSFTNSEGKDVIPFSNLFMLNLTVLFMAHLAAGIIWIAVLTRYKNNVIAPELKKFAEPFEIEEVFLITNSGLLIKRISRKANPDMDDDILSSMLTAVGEFVKDSFGSQSEEGELDELQYGKMRIVIEYGRDLYLAVVVKGQESKTLRPEMKRLLKVIHRKYTRGFESWDGDLAQFRGSEGYLRVLLTQQ